MTKSVHYAPDAYTGGKRLLRRSFHEWKYTRAKHVKITAKVWSEISPGIRKNILINRRRQDVIGWHVSEVQSELDRFWGGSLHSPSLAIDIASRLPEEDVVPDLKGIPEGRFPHSLTLGCLDGLLGKWLPADFDEAEEITLDYDDPYAKLVRYWMRTCAERGVARTESPDFHGELGSAWLVVRRTGRPHGHARVELYARGYEEPIMVTDVCPGGHPEDAEAPLHLIWW